VRLLLKISRCSEDRQARVFQFRADKNGTRASSSSARFITFIHKSTQNSHVKPSHAIHRTRPLRRCQIVLTTISTTISPKHVRVHNLPHRRFAAVVRRPLNHRPHVRCHDTGGASESLRFRAVTRPPLCQATRQHDRQLSSGGVEILRRGFVRRRVAHCDESGRWRQRADGQYGGTRVAVNFY
jgi:hypothetical protein